MKKFAIANPLTRSGTGIGANVWEAQHAESRADFIHKIKISAKEASETEYWLLFNHHSTKYPDATDLLKAVESIQKILNKIIITSKSGGKS
jgi:four helix bundle protein